MNSHENLKQLKENIKVQREYGYFNLFTVLGQFFSEYWKDEEPPFDPSAPFVRRTGHCNSVLQSSNKHKDFVRKLRETWSQVTHPDPDLPKEHFFASARMSGKDYEGWDSDQATKLWDRAIMLAQPPKEIKLITQQYRSNCEFLEASFAVICREGMLRNPNGPNAKGIIFG
jgi:hypothetical protein